MNAIFFDKPSTIFFVLSIIVKIKLYFLNFVHLFISLIIVFIHTIIFLEIYISGTDNKNPFMDTYVSFQHKGYRTYIGSLTVIQRRFLFSKGKELLHESSREEGLLTPYN